MNVLQILTDKNIFQSKGEARRSIAQGAIKINGKAIDDSELQFGDKIITITKGKKIFLFDEDGQEIEIK